MIIYCSMFKIKKPLFIAIACVLLATGLTSCGIYSFNDVSIDYTKIKTIKISYIENKARYVNPLLGPKLTDKLQQKITQQTKLTRTNEDDAHYQIRGEITGDELSYVAITGQQASTNRLTITAHIYFKDIVNDKDEEFDVSGNFDFDANTSVETARQALLEDITRNLTDQIFNKIFSNW